jgi:large subunit ribosomal protein L16
MGSGKGSPESEVTVVVPRDVIFELQGVTESDAREIFILATQKLPVITKFLKKQPETKTKGVDVKKIGD